MLGHKDGRMTMRYSHISDGLTPFGIPVVT